MQTEHIGSLAILAEPVDSFPNSYGQFLHSNFEHVVASVEGWREFVSVMSSYPDLVAVHIEGLDLRDLYEGVVCSEKVRKLSCDGVSLTNDSLQDLLEGLPNLTSLRLSDCGVGEAGVVAIASHLSGLTSLDLSGCDVGEAGVVAIASHLSGLTSLRLSGCDVGEAGAVAIASLLHSLTLLDLNFNLLSDKVAVAISEGLLGLEHLFLDDCSVGDEGARSLVDNLPSLRECSLSYNKISADLVTELIGSHGSKLTLNRQQRN